MVSIIIVHYHVKKELFACLASIYSSQTKTVHEIIVLDNDEEKTIEGDLKKYFPKVRYLPNENKGFGQANNIGATVAKGEFLFFLNPDTTVNTPHTLDFLVSFLQKNKTVGVVAPLLLGKDKKPYQQGSLELTPARGFIVLSFLNKLFPNNKVSQDYFLRDWKFDRDKEVDVVPGTAFMIRKELFKKVRGFDEHFFLFFEEFDFAKRIKQLGFKLCILSVTKVSHTWGASTKNRSDIDSIFSHSRFHYFQKHYGYLWAIFFQLFTSINKYTLSLLGILMFASFLLTYKIYETAPFIGDQGWFYLSARNLVTEHVFPLLGIPSSRPWLHQGATWTYLLAGALWIGHFHPLAGVYMSILLGLCMIIGVYLLARQFFTRGYALLASLLFSTSPAVVQNARMAYHTSPIPLVSILYIFAVLKIIQGNFYFLIGAIFCFFLLYTFELFAVVLLPLIPFAVWFGYKKHKKKFQRVNKQRLLLLSVIAGIIPLFPILLYDIMHGFTQTLGFIAWFGYSMLKAVHLLPSGDTTSWKQLGIQVVDFSQYFLSIPIAFVSLGSILISFCVLLWQVLMKRLWENCPEYLLLVGWVSLPILGIVFTKTASGAYLPILFIPLIFTIIYCIHTFSKATYISGVLFLLCTSLVTSNTVYVLHRYTQESEGTSGLGGRIALARMIKEKIGDEPIAITLHGVGTNFPSSYMNHEYLLWWVGVHVDQTASRHVSIWEKDGNVQLLSVQNTPIK